MEPSGRDHKTDAVLKRLVDLDHAALILACYLQARGPHTVGFQNVDVHDEDDGDNRGPILDVGASQAEADDTETVPALSTDSGPLSTAGRQELTATPAFGGDMENVALIEPQVQDDDDEVHLTIKYVILRQRRWRISPNQDF